MDVLEKRRAAQAPKAGRADGQHARVVPSSIRAEKVSRSKKSQKIEKILRKPLDKG